MGQKNNVVVLAGTKWQIPLIKKLKEKGYRVINFNLLPDSPAFEYSDDYRIVDILDCKACLEYAKELEPLAIMSEECDIATTTIARISKELGLNSISMEMAELYTNKYMMRRFGQEQGFATPAFFKCANIEQAIEAYSRLKGKAIMKPLDSNSSRGVYTVSSEDDVRKYFEQAIAFSKVEKSVLLEEYIEGVEFTVDGIKTEEGHVSLAISEKKHYEYNENIACSLFFSHYSSEYNYEELRKINDKFVEMSGLTFGLTHAEYKYCNGKFYLIEIGARGGGNLISAVIVPLMSGVDNYEFLIEKTVNNNYSEDISILPELWDRCAVLQFFDTEGKSGIVKEICGEEFFKKSEKIVEYSIYCTLGDRVVQAEDDSKRIGYYIAYGENKAELEKIINQVNKLFKIVLEDK